MNINEFRKQVELLFTDIREAIEESEASLDLRVQDLQMTISQKNAEGITLVGDVKHQLLIVSFNQERKFEFYDGQWLCAETELSLIPLLGDALNDLYGADLGVYL